MEKYTIEITEGKIREYLKKYENYYKYYEPLFIQYLKDNRNKLTDEILEILTDGSIKFDNSGQLPCFDTSPSNINNLDITGIYHILVPAMRFYYPDKKKISFDFIDYKGSKVADIFGLNRDVGELGSVLENYEVCKNIYLKNNYNDIVFNIGREYSRKQLIAYETFYGEEEVKKVRKIIREG